MGTRSRAMRVGSPHSVQTTITLEACSGIGFSMMPACKPRPARTCFLAMLMPSTITLFSRGIARCTVAVLPRSLPAITRTLSPLCTCSLARCRGLRSRSFVAILPLLFFPCPLAAHSSTRAGALRPARVAPAVLEHFGGERDDSHAIAVTQLAGNRPEDTCAAWIIAGGDDNRGIVVEADMAAVGPPLFLGDTHDDGGHHFTLLGGGRSPPPLHGPLSRVRCAGVLCCR